ncbi:MAG: hypothetical protein SGPRY_000615 [Prymnesium sp.]
MPVTRGPAPDFPIILRTRPGHPHARLAEHDLPSGRPAQSQADHGVPGQAVRGRAVKESTRLEEVWAWAGVSQFSSSTSLQKRGAGSSMSSTAQDLLRCFMTWERKRWRISMDPPVTLSVVNPNNLVLKTQDVQRRGSFDTPAANAPSGRGRGQAARALAVQGPP